MSVFETDKCEFIIPEELYTRRLQALENALRARGSVFEGLEAFVFYQSDNTRAEDEENQLFEGKIEGSKEDDTHPDAHLRGSGFEVVQVNSQEYSDHFSPWEIVVEDVKAGRPGLSDDDKKSILEALNVQLRKPGVREHLSQSVDEVRYSDYAKMVEVPIDMMFIKRRLESDYYATKLSVAADVKLIRDNCVKYNGTANDLSRLARVMYEEFEREILSDEDRSHIVSEEGFVAAADEGPGQVQQAQHVPNLRTRVRQPSTAAGNASQSTYGLRDRSRTRRQSALETLPSPPVARGGRRALRNEFEASTNQRRSTRATDAARDTEVLGRVSRTRGRLRSDSHTEGNSSSLPARPARHSRGEGEEEAEPVSRAARSQRNATVNHDSENDIDESEDEVLTSRRSQRSSRRSTLEVAESEDESLTMSSRATAGATRGRAASQPPASSRSLRAAAPRSSRRQSNFESDNSASEDEEKEIEQSDEDDNLESDSEEDDGGRARRRTPQPSPTRARRTTPTRSGRAVTSVAAREPESPTRRSHRSPGEIAVSYADAPSEDFEPEDGESEEEESEKEEPPAKRRSRAANSYAELPSDFEEDEEEDDEDDEDDYPNRKREAARATPKRQRGKSTIPYLYIVRFVATVLIFPIPSPAPSNSRSSSKKKKTEPELPKVKEWPEIDLPSIPRVSRTILKKVVRYRALHVNECLRIALILSSRFLFALGSS